MKYLWCGGITLALSFLFYGQKDLNEHTLAAVQISGQGQEKPTKRTPIDPNPGAKRKRLSD